MLYLHQTDRSIKAPKNTGIRPLPVQLDLPGFEPPDTAAADRYGVRPLVTCLHQLGLPNSTIRELCAIVLLCRWATESKPHPDPLKPASQQKLLGVLADHLSPANIRVATVQSLQESLFHLASEFAAHSQSPSTPYADYLGAFADMLNRVSAIPSTALTPVIEWLARPDPPQTSNTRLLECFEESLQATDYRWTFASPEWLLTLFSNLNGASNPASDPDPTVDPSHFTTLPEPQTVAELLSANADARQLLAAAPHKHDFMLGVTQFVLQQKRPHAVPDSLNDTPLTSDDHPMIGAPFDLVLTNPPFSAKMGNPEELHITRTLESLAPNGRAAIIVPAGFLYRSGSAQHLRRRLVEEGYLEAVISLPAHTFTSAPNVSTAILLLQAASPTPARDTAPGKKAKSSRTKPVLLIDGTNLLGDATARESAARILSLLEAGRQSDAAPTLTPPTAAPNITETDQPTLPASWLVSVKQLARSQWNLSVGPRQPPDPDWLRTEGGQELSRRSLIHPLGSYAELRAGHYVENSELSDNPTGEGTLGYLRIQDLSDGVVKVPTRWVIPTRAQKTGDNHLLRAGDALLSRSGTIDKAAVFSDEVPPAIAGIALYVISVDRRRLDPHFLVAWLHSRMTRDWLKTHSQRTVQPNLTLSLLAGMKIPVPTLELQAKAVAQARDAGVELFDSLCEALGIPTNKDAPRP